jgi:CopG family nickel-responsive transcriptional regulator
VYCIACLSYVYNHHERDLSERLTGLQHAHHELTISSMHAHLDHDHCLETVILKGQTAAVQRFADAVCAERGVHHGKVNLISVDVHAPAGIHPAPGAPGHLHVKPTS